LFRNKNFETSITLRRESKDWRKKSRLHATNV